MLLTALATLPFLGKAFHIDDFCYLEAARQVLRDPWRPYDGHFLAAGRMQAMADYNWSPPLFSYVLAGGILLFGEFEPALHLISASFLAATALAVYALAVRFTRHSLLATALVVLNPLLLPGQNLMLDVPMLALGLGGIACHIHGTDRRRWSVLLLGGLLSGLAIVTKYPALVTVLLMGAYSLLRRSARGVVPMLLALVPLALWSWQNVHAGGPIHLWSQRTGAVWDVGGSGLRLAALLTVLGSGWPAYLLVPRSGFGWRLHVAMGFGCALLVLALRLVHAPGGDVVQIAHHVVFLSGGLFVLASCAAGAYLARRATPAPAPCDDWFLLGWLFVGLLIAIGAPFVAVRHLAWALPAGSLLLVRHTRPGAWGFAIATVAATLTCVSGLGAACADLERANLSRFQAAHVVEQSRGAVIFVAGEHTCGHYCRRMGLPPLRCDFGEFVEGDFVVVAPAEHPAIPSGMRPYLRLVSTVGLRGWVPMNVNSPGVSYYATGTDNLPWELGRAGRVFQELYVVSSQLVEDRLPERCRDLNIDGH